MMVLHEMSNREYFLAIVSIKMRKQLSIHMLSAPQN
jgi:hypothetical protein